MEKIESFKVNHLTLESGIYVSRIDKSEGVTVTTATIISPYMILTNGKLVLDKAALAKIEEVFA